MQPVEDRLAASQQRVKELEADLEKLREDTRKLIVKRGAEAIKDADDAYNSAQSEFQQKPIDERIGAEAFVLAMFVDQMLSAHKATFDEVADRFEAANATIHGPGSMDHQQWKTYRGFLEPFLDLVDAADALEKFGIDMDPHKKEEPEAPYEPELGEHLKPTFDDVLDQASN